MYLLGKRFNREKMEQPSNVNNVENGGRNLGKRELDMDEYLDDIVAYIGCNGARKWK